MKNASRGFTLIEILLAVGLIGIIASVALAPLVFTVISLEDAQKNWSSERKEDSAVDTLFRDIRNIVKNQAFASLQVIHKDGLRVKEDDRVLIWSGSPAREGQTVGLVVYRVLEESTFDKTVGGLYRWTVMDVIASSDQRTNKPASPMDFDVERLEAKQGKLLLPGVTGMRFRVWREKKWVDEYEGDSPVAVSVELIQGEEKHTHETWLPQVFK